MSSSLVTSVTEENEDAGWIQVSIFFYMGLVNGIYGESIYMVSPIYGDFLV